MTRILRRVECNSIYKDKNIYTHSARAERLADNISPANKMEYRSSHVLNTLLFSYFLQRVNYYILKELQDKLGIVVCLRKRVTLNLLDVISQQ